MLSFSHVEKMKIKEHFMHDPMTLSTFMGYTQKLIAHVKQKVATSLPDKFALVLDGWSSSSAQFVAVFASFPSTNVQGYSVRLLAFFLVEDEIDLGADEHVSLFDHV